MGLTTIIGIAGAAVKGVSGFTAARYRARVAKNNAAIYTDNADRIQQEAGVSAQDNDIRAAGEIGQLLAVQGASGVDMTSGSALRARVSAYKLASRDRGYTIAAGEAAATRALQGAADEQGKARQAASAGIFSLISGALGVGSAVVNGQTASATNERISLLG